MQTLYKSMREGLRSGYDSSQWKIGEWRKDKRDPMCCNSGFHASKRIVDAMQYTNLANLALVEVKGKCDKQSNKEAWEYMRIKKAWKWTKKDSVALSIYSAELCLKNFKKVFPNDKRPREAIEAAKEYLKNPCEKTRSAARFAARSTWSAAWSAESAAWSAAESAARSAAKSAAWSAESAAKSAARSAAWSAESAAWSAESAARSAGLEKILNKIEKWVLKRIKKLEEIK